MTRKGDVAIVTGAASGIGRATALGFARLGMELCLIDRSSAMLDEVVATIRATDGTAHAIVADLGSEHGVKQAFTQMRRGDRRLVCAANCAGIDPEVEMLDIWDLQCARRAIEVNLFGTMACMQHEIIAMLDGSGGSIVNVSSMAAMMTLPGKPGYCGSKHAMIGLTQTAAAQYGRRRIRVNAVCPGPIRTPLVEQILTVDGVEQAIGERTALGRWGEPEEVANLVVWLCSEQASYVTGQSIAIDGGYTLNAP